MERVRPSTGTQSQPDASIPVCAARCPECGKPCLHAVGHPTGEPHSCERNHRWGLSGEAELPLKAR